MKQTNRVGDFERDLHRLQTENRRLREENLTAKNNLLDMETFAKESVDGGNAEEIIRKLKQRDDEEISRIEEKVWEGRIKDAHQRIESLEQARLKSYKLCAPNSALQVTNLILT